MNGCAPAPARPIAFRAIGRGERARWVAGWTLGLTAAVRGEVDLLDFALGLAGHPELFRLWIPAAVGLAVGAGGAWLTRPGLRAPPFEPGGRGVWLPVSRFSPRRRWLAYERIRCVVQVEFAWRRRLMVDRVGALPLQYPASWFPDAPTLDRLEAALRSGVRRLADGDARIAAIDRRRAVARAISGRSPRVTFALAALLVLGGSLQLATGSFDWLPGLLVQGAASHWLVAGGGAHRLFACSLLHLTEWHLAVNLASLLLIGALIEPLLGGWRVAVVALAGGWLGIAATAFLTWSPMVGSSVAIAALAGGLVAVNVARRAELPPPWLLGGPVVALAAAVMAGFGLVVEQIGDLGHAIGALAGLAVCWPLLPSVDWRRPGVAPPRWIRAAATVCAAVWLAGLGQALARAAATTPERALRKAVPYWDDPRLGDDVRIASAYVVGLDADASRPLVERSVAQLRRLQPRMGPHPDLLDGIAAQSYRLGDLDAAAQYARRSFAAAPTHDRVADLAHFTWLRLRTGGGTGGAGAPVRVVAAPDAAGRWRLVGTAGIARPAVVDVIALRGSEIVGLLRVAVRKLAGDAVALPPDALAAVRDATDLALHVGHVEPGAGSDVGIPWRWWDVDSSGWPGTGWLPFPEAEVAAD